MKTKRVLFRFDGEPIGEVYRDEAGNLIATTDRVRWIIGEAIFIHPEWIQPGDSRFVESLPQAYAGGRFNAELVEE